MSLCSIFKPMTSTAIGYAHTMSVALQHSNHSIRLTSILTHGKIDVAREMNALNGSSFWVWRSDSQAIDEPDAALQATKVGRSLKLRWGIHAPRCVPWLAATGYRCLSFQVPDP